MDRHILKTHLHFEILAKLFFGLAEERYPSSDKILQLLSKVVDPVPVVDEYEILHLKIAILTAMRNMVKEVAPNHLYRSIQHRDELYAGIIEALDELEDQLEEMQDEMTEEEED